MKTFLISDQSNISQQILKLPTCTGVKVIDTCTIVRIEAISNYSKFFFLNGKTLVVAKVLRWFEECLGADQFIRLHRTHIVNQKMISHYTSCEGGEVKLINGERIAVSRRRKSQFLQSWHCMTS
jgi:two-component system, LytTR family, response regulator